MGYSPWGHRVSHDRVTDTFTFFHMGGKMTRSSRGRLFLGWWVSFCGGKKQLKTTKQAASLFDGNPGVSLFSLAWIGLDFSMIRKTEKNPNEPT